jgi:hypothetical protein
VQIYNLHFNLQRGMQNVSCGPQNRFRLRVVALTPDACVLICAMDHKAGSVLN